MNGTYGNTGTGQQTGLALIDDLLRRELRIGDPRNAVEIVTALRRRYVSDAARLDQEAAGLPIRYQMPSLPAPTVSVGGDTPGSKEERRVLVHMESDLAGLIESRDNREWAPEIRGWRDVLLGELADGTAAARLAQDPAMRARGFLAVRKLGEFARVARLVGVMNLPLNCDYRRLACSLDHAANVIRILMGEALYEAGLADGGLIIQVPLSDLRVRRDALVLAVRRLNGTFGSTEDGDDWGDGLAAYRALLDELDRRGAPELTVYLREEFVAGVLDGLVGSMSRQDPETLRRVAATAPVEIARLNQLIVIAAPLAVALPPPPAIPNATAPALNLFVQSLQLFVDAFEAVHAGARLIDLAVPLSMASQQHDEADREARRILREVVSRRGDYAAEVECFLSCCGCDLPQLAQQVLLDKVLFDIDRAIDLYAQGESFPPSWGDVPTPPGVFVFSEERRASAYSVVVQALITLLGGASSASRPTLVRTLTAIVAELDDALPTAQDARDALVDAVLEEQLRAEADWETLVASLAPRCLDARRADLVRTVRVQLLRRASPARVVPPLPPLPVRVGVQRISDVLISTRGPSTPAQSSNPGPSRGGRKQARKGARKGVTTPSTRSTAPDRSPRKRSTGQPGALSRPRTDPQVVMFVEMLESASGSAGELRSAVRRERIREQWASLKSRSAQPGQSLPADLEHVMDALLDPSTRDQIDMTQVREVFQKILSHELGD